MAHFLDGLVPNAEDIPARGLQKGPSRLQVKTAAKKLTTMTDRQFRDAVHVRDKGRCRCCQRKVTRTIGRTPERAEVHHIHGRTGELRHDVRAALLLCLSDHEKVTGKVNEKVIIHATKEFLSARGHRYIDATYPVRFERVT